MGKAIQSRFGSLLLVTLSLSGCQDSSKDDLVQAEAVTLAPAHRPGATACESSTGTQDSQAQVPEPGPGTSPGAGQGSSQGQGSGEQESKPDLGLAAHPLCVGRKNGEFCGDFAVCIDQRCLPSVCGDGVVHPGHEECEDGNRERDDGCHACRLEVCGDGRIQPGEACDDGNNVRGDGCDHQCQRTAKNLCGNGKIDGKEQCDDGNLEHHDACRNDCLFHAPENCGNGTIDPGETCDDGNLRENDGCGPSCQIETCGDGFIRGKVEQCDDGNQRNGDGCSADCKVEAPVCGNAKLDPGEDCDDGNNRNADDCPNDCKNPVCADGVIDGHESCDDGNREDGDGCSADCVKETRCGNGIVEFQVGGEQCDDGNDNNFDRCPNNCRLPRCGDGVRSGPMEECDGDDAPEGKNCDDACFIKPLCGNGIVERSVRYLETSEVCDDGNTENGDTCAFDCRGIDESKCGDGVVQKELGEQCDLGPVPDGLRDDEILARSYTCHQCQWTYFDQECSECMGREVVTPVPMDELCASSDPGPCRDVVACYAKERCATPNLGPMSCSCGDLPIRECMEAESFPGPCHGIAVARSFDPKDENRSLQTEKGKFFSSFLNVTFPFGRAGQHMVAMQRFCPEACAKYHAPVEEAQSP